MSNTFGGGMDVDDLFDNSHHSAPVPTGDLGSGKSEFASSGGGFGGSDPTFEYYLDGMLVWGTGWDIPGRFDVPNVPTPNTPIGPSGPSAPNWVGSPEAPVQKCAKDRHLPSGQCTPTSDPVAFAEEIPQANTADLVPSGEDRVHLVTRRAGGVARCDLVLLLHGRGGSPTNVKEVADDFARVGFDVISLHWSSDPTAFATCDEPNVNVPGDEWNDCIEETRDDKLTESILGVLPALQFVLDELIARDPDGDWSDFVKSDGTPNFERMIFAGYSEGANQSAWNSRLFNNRGLILLSGGGDAGTQDFDLADGDPELADWMFPVESPSSRHVALRHKDENFEYQTGWDASGVGSSEALYRPGTVATISDFGGADRLTRNDELPEKAAHDSTIRRSPVMSLARQYLACRAGGVL